MQVPKLPLLSINMVAKYTAAPSLIRSAKLDVLRSRCILPTGNCSPDLIDLDLDLTADLLPFPLPDISLSSEALNDLARTHTNKKTIV